MERQTPAKQDGVREAFKSPFLCFPSTAHKALPDKTHGAAQPGEWQLATLCLGFQSKMSSWAPVVASGILECWDHGRVGSCVKQQAAASAQHWEWKGTANPWTPRALKRKPVCLHRHHNDNNFPFLLSSTPDTLIEEKQKSKRNPVHFPFCFLSLYISAFHSH